MSASKRKLAAIVFTDIVGFTRLSAENQSKSSALIKKQREAFQPIVKNYNGTWIKEMGDGLLLTFGTIIDAVKSSIEMQRVSDDIEGLNLRIGIHLGEVIVDGNDVLEVHDLMTKLVKQIRGGSGPAFVEAQTYRIQGHSIADPANYRPEDEVNEWKLKDPIPSFKDWLLANGHATQDIIDQMHQTAEQEIIEAAEFAEQSPFPADEELYTGVYAE